MTCKKLFLALCMATLLSSQQVHTNNAVAKYVQLCMQQTRSAAIDNAGPIAKGLFISFIAKSVSYFNTTSIPSGTVALYPIHRPQVLELGIVETGLPLLIMLSALAAR